MNLLLLLEMAGAVDPDRPVFQFGEEQVTAGVLQTRARRIGGSLAADGTSNLVFAAANSLAFPVAVFAASAAGIPLVPVNYRLADDRQNDILDRHPGALIIADEPRLSALRHAGRRAIGPDQFLSLADETGGPDGTFADEPDPDDVAVLLYTSGTTSEPKAVVLRHRHLTSYVLGTVEYGAADASDAALVAVPPYHVAGVAHVLTNLYSGRRVIYLDAFDAKDWLRLVREERVTHAMVVPTMLARIVECLQNTGESAPPSLESIVYGGAAMPRRVLEAALLLFPDVGFVNAYGLTETASTIALLSPDDHRRALDDADPAARDRLRSAGRAVPGIDIEIRGPNGAPLGPGHEGEIHVRGAQVSGEYLGTTDPAAGDADGGGGGAGGGGGGGGGGGSGGGGGWFATRDTGYLDDEGYLFIMGRFDDTIIRGGENIAPVEIEEVIATQPGVADCAVVGVADDDWGQRIAAIIVPTADATLTAEDVRTWVRSRVRGSRTPDQVEFRASLPYTETGKLLRRALRQELEAVDSPPTS